MKELERVNSALTKAMAGLACAGYMETLKEVNEILNPPPEMETVIESIWRHKVTMEVVDDQPPLADIENWQEYVGSVKRPKPQKVQRSVVNVDATVTTAGETIAIHSGSCGSPFKYNTECHGKNGTLTFTWEE